MDVPYYRYLYPPNKELACLSEFENFCKILRSKGYSAECIYLSEIVVKGIENLGYVSDSVAEMEKSSPSLVEQNLENELVREIAEILKQRLGEKDISHCAILLRAGSLFPFVHISTLLSYLEGKVKCTLIIPYPANKDGEMLCYKGETIRSYYRGEAI